MQVELGTFKRGEIEQYSITHIGVAPKTLVMGREFDGALIKMHIPVGEAYCCYQNSEAQDGELWIISVAQMQAGFNKHSWEKVTE